MSVVLVTGSSGFIGKNLTRYLKSNHFQVIGLDYQLPCQPSSLDKESMTTMLSKFGLDGFIKYRLGENSEDVREAVLEKMQGVQYVVHLASQSHVDRSISSPKQFIDDNVGGTLELFELCRHLPELKRIVHFGTDEVVACIPEGSVKEDALFKCGSVYSASKGAQELLVQAYLNTYNLPIVISRCVNVFGPEQATEKFIPKTIWSAINDREVQVYGSGYQTREWVYVDHVCDVVNWLMQNPIIPDGKILHITGTKEYPNLVLANLILGKLGKTGLIKHVGDRLGHDTRYALDPGDAFIIWDMPKYSGKFLEDLDKTINWYLENTQKEIVYGI